MNENCAIARDLMPQVIGRVASDESQAYVEKHVVTCEPCAQFFRDMRKNIPDVDECKEKEAEPSFKAAMSQLHKTIVWKRFKAVLFAVLIILLGYVVYQFVFLNTNWGIMPLNTYKVAIYKGIDNAAYGATHFLKNYPATGPALDFENNNEIMYIYWQCAIIPVETDNLPQPNPQYGIFLTMTPDGSLSWDGTHVIKEIRQGTKNNYITVYRAGDEITEIDPAVEEYLRREDTLADTMQAAQQMEEDAQDELWSATNAAKSRSKKH